MTFASSRPPIVVCHIPPPHPPKYSEEAVEYYEYPYYYTNSEDGPPPGGVPEEVTVGRGLSVRLSVRLSVPVVLQSCVSPPSRSMEGNGGGGGVHGGCCTQGLCVVPPPTHAVPRDLTLGALCFVFPPPPPNCSPPRVGLCVGVLSLLLPLHRRCRRPLPRHSGS